jgi:hypothetical protein
MKTTTHPETMANGRMGTKRHSPRLDRLQGNRVGSDFFVGLAVAMPLALLLWVLLAWSIWFLMR